MGTDGRPERRVTVTDPRALSTLAHPLRLRLLSYLLRAGPRTAQECAEALHDTGANCSYHLRHLARHGLVERAERAEGADRRQRPWQAAATGFDFVGDPADAGTEAARSALESLQLDELTRLIRRHLEQRARLDPGLRDAAALSTYALAMTPAELADLGARLDELIRPFVAATRHDPPPDALPVHLSLQAFPHPGEA